MILLDPRTGSKHLAPLFKGLGCPFEITPLSFGDCAFIGNGPDGPVRVGIELKGGRGGSDFLQSMQSGRLVGHQVEGIADAYDRRYLIIEGLRASKNGIVWTPPRKGGRMRPIFMADINKYITGLEESGLRVRRTLSPEHTARVIFKELYGFWQKEYDEHTSIAANVLYQPAFFSLVRENPVEARIRRVAVALKAGIGVGRSKPVAERFGSVYDLVTADEQAWEGIEGVGRKIAGDVRAAIHARVQLPKNTQPASAKGVSPGHGVAAGSTRRTRKRQDRELDTSRRAQRRIRKAETSGRVPDRH